MATKSTIFPAGAWRSASLFWQAPCGCGEGRYTRRDEFVAVPFDNNQCLHLRAY